MIFLSFVILEVLLVLFGPLLSSFWQYEPDLGFRVRPYAQGSNKFGFNDRDYSLQKNDNNYRILVIGDSFNWAGGKENNYTAILERKFETLYKKHCVDVINIGYPMTHTGEQLAMLKKFGLRYNPDLVFLGFFAGNDFVDADPNRKRIVILDTYVDIDKRKECAFFGYPIILKSRLWLVIKHYFVVLTKNNAMFHRVNKEIAREEGKEGTFSESAFLKIERARLEFCNIKAHQDGAYSAQKQYIFQSLMEMRNILKGENIDFIVGIYPDEFQVNKNLLERICQKYGLEREDYDVSLIQKILKEFLESEGIVYIDLLDKFRVLNKNEPLYKLRDTHWNDAGNKLASDLIFDKIMQVVDRNKLTLFSTSQND